MVEAEGRASWAASARATARLSSPTRTRSRISRALMRMDLGGGGGLYYHGVSRGAPVAE